MYYLGHFENLALMDELSIAGPGSCFFGPEAVPMLAAKLSVYGNLCISYTDVCVQGAAEKSSPLKFFTVFSSTV